MRVKLTNKWGMILLGLWLILWGLLSLPGNVVLPLLAIVAGVLILLDR